MKSLFTFLFFILITSCFGQSNWVQVSEYDAQARHHPVTFSLNGFGYLLTGGTGSSLLADFWRYDPGLDSWEQLPDFPGGARGFSYGVAHQGKAYVGFGLWETDNGNSLSHNDLWEYDPATEEWTSLSRCTCPGRFHPAFVALNGKLFVGLGASTTFGDLRDWFVYDIATDTWEKKKDLPAAARHHPYYFGIGDYVYAGMGHSGPVIYDDLYRYDLSTDTWEQMASIPGQGRVAGTQFDYQGEGYVLAGQNEQHTNFPVGEFWKYTPETDSWTELEAFPLGSRWAPGSFVINDELYFTSGEDNGGTYNNDMWKIDLNTTVDTKEPPIQYSGIGIYPNPSSEVLNFDLEGINLDLAKAKIYDNTGKLIQESKINNNSLNISHLMKGVYKLLIETKETTYIESFLKM